MLNIKWNPDLEFAKQIEDRAILVAENKESARKGLKEVQSPMPRRSKNLNENIDIKEESSSASSFSEASLDASQLKKQWAGKKQMRWYEKLATQGMSLEVMKNVSHLMERKSVRTDPGAGGDSFIFNKLPIKRTVTLHKNA